jgi:formate hydrogenlyase subunit 6/NADH:ubiquinone oxidoreductase subunit I
MNNLYLYFSGTGNTKYVVKQFVDRYEEGTDFTIQSIEEQGVNFSILIEEAKLIVIAYPIHEGLLPHIMSEFLMKYKEHFRNKDIITICSQMIFSGDGAALPIYILKENNVILLHGIHINMPNNLADFWFLPLKTAENSSKKYKKANAKITRVVSRIKKGKKVKNGIRFYSWPLGFFIQRAYTKHHYNRIRSDIKIDYNTCINCDKCISVCPVDNLYSKDKKIQVKDQCTICYRCINVCPTQSISLITNHKPTTQYILNDYN